MCPEWGSKASHAIRILAKRVCADAKRLQTVGFVAERLTDSCLATRLHHVFQARLVARAIDDMHHRGSLPERFARKAMIVTGTTPAFLIALGVIVVWAITGPVFHFSDTWQLVINTGTTIVTFLMVFLIQRAQNKDAQAVALKLNEIVAAIEGASNRLIDVEELSEEDLAVLGRHYKKLVVMAKSDGDLTRSHSIEEAERRHAYKVRKLAHSVDEPDQRREHKPEVAALRTARRR